VVKVNGIQLVKIRKMLTAWLDFFVINIGIKKININWSVKTPTKGKIQVVNGINQKQKFTKNIKSRRALARQ